MKKVYLLQHSYEYDDCEETKIIGIYSSKEKADLVIEKYKKLPGFKHYPDCFFIDGYKIDEDNWQDGFLRNSVKWNIYKKPDENKCPESFCFLWSVSEEKCDRAFGKCKREDATNSNRDFYEPCEAELEKFGLPWFYFIPSEEKLVEERREEYRRESKKLWGV
ncbi:MAG: hypothetical protein N3B21_14075 [Clostridia bacterium]|nr:hypothetical protein [Clostridia bacterium]